MRWITDTNFINRNASLPSLLSNLSKIKTQQASLQAGRIIKPLATSAIPNNDIILPNGLNKDESLLFTEAKKQGATNNQIAYILGTAKHESANFQTMTEYASGQAYEGRTDLGNNQQGDGVKYKGAGYVQITGRNNYAKYSKLTGLDLINKPDLAKDPKTSAFITVNGILNGNFTGAKLSDYVNNNKSDFINARRTVNGTDQAKLIAGYANEYLKKLK
jgi:hypothetical protein